MGNESGLTIAMRQLAIHPELFKHSYLTAWLCKNLVSKLPQHYLAVSIENICLAALFHDLGKASWPQHWFYKSKHQLDDNEWQVMKKHPHLGAEMLKNLVPGIPQEVIRLIANHHERPGGVGYPMYLNDVPKDVLVLAACDVYCACTQTRGYRKEVLKPDDALEVVADFAPQEVVQGLWALQKEDCHECFPCYIGEAKSMGAEI